MVVTNLNHLTGHDPSENGEHTVLGQQISQFADPLIAQRPAIVPGQPEPNQPRLDHSRNSS